MVERHTLVNHPKDVSQPFNCGLALVSRLGGCANEVLLDALDHVLGRIACDIERLGSFEDGRGEGRHDEQKC
jgi:hypothetical protein